MPIHVRWSDWGIPPPILPLAGDYGAHVSNSNDEVSDGLEEEVDIEVVLPVQKIIARAEEEEGGESQLQGIDSVHNSS